MSSSNRCADEVRFAVAADIQYADKPDAEGRAYRTSLARLDDALAGIDGRSLDFLIQMGDAIDGYFGEGPDGVVRSRSELALVLTRLARLGVDVHHVVGNHDLAIPRSELLEQLGTRGRHEFVVGAWRFIVLDTLELSVLGVANDDERYVEADAWLAAHPIERFPQATRWGGGVGPEQLAWLESRLARAVSRGERVLVFGHNPVHPGAARPTHLAWDYREVLAVLESSRATVAYIAGHDHRGGYSLGKEIHHWTLTGLVTPALASDAVSLVELAGDHLRILAPSGEPRRELALRPRRS